MLLGDFGRKLKKLNKNLWIIAKDTGKPAGINLRFEGEWVNICSIDKNDIPMLPIRDKAGHYVKGGWRRAIKNLIDRRLIDRRQAERVFRCGFDVPNPGWRPEADPVMKTLQEIREKRLVKDGKGKDGKVPFKRNDIMDMASVVRSARR